MQQQDPWAEFRVQGAPQPSAQSFTPVLPRTAPPPTPETPEQLRSRRLQDRARELEIQGREREAERGGLTPVQINELRTRYDGLNGFESAVDEIEGLYRENLEGDRGSLLGFGGDRNLRARLPLAPTGYGAMDAAAGRLIGSIMQMYGTTGGEANSMAEIRARFGPFLPNSTDSDAQIESKLRGLRGELERWRATIGTQLQAAGIAMPEPQAQQAPQPAPEDGPRVTAAGMDPRTELSTGDEQVDPAREAVRAQAQQRITQMLTGGASDDEIRAYARSLNIDAEAALRFRRSPDWQRWRRQNPNQAYPITGANIPMGGVSSAVAGAAASPVGTAITRFGNSMIPGAVAAIGDLAGTGEQTRLGLDAMAEENPTAAMIGDIGGAVAGYAGGGAIAGRVLPAAVVNSRAAPLLADAAYGAAQGYGENYDPLSGAAESAIGGAIGRRLARGVASTISPIGGAARPLYDAAVRPTLGQRGRDTGFLGDTANFIEEAAQSFPVGGRAIRAGRQSARDQWERGAWDQALANIGEQLPAGTALGPASHRRAQRAFNDAYTRVRANLSLQGSDPDWAADLTQIRADADLLAPKIRRRFTQILDDEVSRRIINSGGVLNGQNFTAASSAVGREIRRLRNLRSPTQGQQELLGSLESLDDAMHQAARRSSPPDVVDELNRVDRGYAMLARIEEASLRRPLQRGRFTPSDLQYAESGSGGARGRRYAAGQGLFGDYVDQGRRLEDVLPSSGTGERTATMNLANNVAPYALPAAAAGGTAYVSDSDPYAVGGVASIPLLMSLAGSNRLTRAAMAPRGGRARTVADFIRQYDRVGGGMGAALTAYGVDR